MQNNSKAIQTALVQARIELKDAFRNGTPEKAGVIVGRMQTLQRAAYRRAKTIQLLASVLGK